MAPALLTAFSTASSSATLPITLDCVQKRAGVSPRVAGFVLPLGTSINHAGSALYECAAALFIAQAYGLHLPVSTQVTVVLLALVTSMGTPDSGRPLVGITVILTAVGLPAEAIGVLLVLDRLLDMARIGQRWRIPPHRDRGAAVGRRTCCSPRLSRRRLGSSCRRC
jgi:Na+/H+-dicarboxylate symporter